MSRIRELKNFEPKVGDLVEPIDKKQRILSYGQLLPQAVILKISLIQDRDFSNSLILDKN